MTPVPDRNLALELIRVTETAALAAAPWIGRGDKDSADGAAVKAMRSLINNVDMANVIPGGVLNNNKINNMYYFIIYDGNDHTY